MSDTDRLSFEEAARELGISESELEEKVAQGEIACIKEGDQLYFKRSVIEQYKAQGGGTEPTVLISDEELNLLEEEEDLGDIDFGIDLEVPSEEEAETAKAEEAKKPAPAAAAEEETAGLASEETVLNLDGILEEESAGAGGGLLEEVSAAETGLGEETLLDTDLLDLGEGEDTDTFELDTTEDTLIEEAQEGTLLRAGGARVMQMKRKQSQAGWTAVLIVSSLLLLLPLGVLLSQAYWERLSGPQVLAAEAAVLVRLDDGLTPEEVDELQAKLRDQGYESMYRESAGKKELLVYSRGGTVNYRALQAVEGVKEVSRAPEGTYAWIQKYNFLKPAVEALADALR